MAQNATFRVQRAPLLVIGEAPQGRESMRTHLPGHSFDDCDALSGNGLDRAVTWHGEPDLRHADGSPVILRFRLRTAKLFSVRFE